MNSRRLEHRRNPEDFSSRLPDEWFAGTPEYQADEDAEGGTTDNPQSNARTDEARESRRSGRRDGRPFEFDQPMNPIRHWLIDGVGDGQHFHIVIREHGNELQLRSDQPLHHGRIFAFQFEDGLVIPSLMDLQQVLFELQRGEADLGGPERLLLRNQHQRHQHRQACQKEEPSWVESEEWSRRSHLW